jgi:hypothetical protein
MSEWLDEVDGRHFDLFGTPISIREWMELFRDTEKRIVAQDHVGNYFISTVWLGLDHGWGGPPLFFETMVFDQSGERPHQDLGCWRYSTWVEAELGHAEHLNELKLSLAWSEGVTEPTSKEEK